MLTPERFVDMGADAPNIVWLNGLELLAHCLVGDYKKSLYKDQWPTRTCLDGLREELEKHTDGNEDFHQVSENVYWEDYRRRHTRADSGDLNIGRYVNGDENCFDETIKEMEDECQDAVSVILDMNIAYEDRQSNEMVQRHKKIYEIVLKCEAEQIPCRVTACFSIEIPERENDFTFYIVIKNYDDPIFPGIWGAFKSNVSTNDFINVIMDFLIGTESGRNGLCKHMSVREEIQDDKIIVIDPKRVRE